MSIGSQDLAGALLWIGCYLLVIAAVTGLTVWVARRRGSTTIVLDATQAVARVSIALAAIGAIATAWRWSTQGEITITSLPITIDWPTPLPLEPTGTGPELVGAYIHSATATASGLSAAPRILLASADLLSIVLFATPAVVIAVLCRQALRGMPFARTTSRWMFGSAIVVLVAGTFIAVLGGIGRTLAAGELLPGIDSGAPVVSQGLFQLTVPLWPMAAALALATLGVVFRHGGRLQRETEGLV